LSTLIDAFGDFDDFVIARSGDHDVAESRAPD